MLTRMFRASLARPNTFHCAVKVLKSGSRIAVIGSIVIYESDMKAEALIRSLPK
jgi:hypothetical protein